MRMIGACGGLSDNAALGEMQLSPWKAGRPPSQIAAVCPAPYMCAPSIDDAGQWSKRPCNRRAHFCSASLLQSALRCAHLGKGLEVKTLHAAFLQVRLAVLVHPQVRVVEVLREEGAQGSWS